VVVDPVARALTHLVVEPRHRARAGRLVPVDLVESTTDVILLRCTIAEFDALENAAETQFLPGAGNEWGYGPQDSFTLPYYRARQRRSRHVPRPPCGSDAGVVIGI
jgi:hypothetical protein